MFLIWLYLLGYSNQYRRLFFNLALKMKSYALILLALLIGDSFVVDTTASPIILGGGNSFGAGVLVGALLGAGNKWLEENNVYLEAKTGLIRNLDIAVDTLQYGYSTCWNSRFFEIEFVSVIHARTCLEQKRILCKTVYTSSIEELLLNGIKPFRECKIFELISNT